MKNNKKNEDCHDNKLTNQLSFKIDFQKVDQHTGGKWLVRGNKHHKDNQLQSPELPCRAS